MFNIDKMALRDFLRLFLAAILAVIASKIFDIAFGESLTTQLGIMLAFLIFTVLLYTIAHWIKF